MKFAPFVPFCGWKVYGLLALGIESLNSLFVCFVFFVVPSASFVSFAFGQITGSFLRAFVVFVSLCEKSTWE